MAENMEGGFGLIVSTHSYEMENEDGTLVCTTPTENTFNPFAPALEDRLLAPKKKTVKESRIPLRKKLNFQFCMDHVIDEGNKEEEDQLLKLLNESFFELVISHQLKELSENNLLNESSSSIPPRTPTLIPLLTGIAETCPGAPIRSGPKLRKLTDSMCRILEFSTNMEC